VCLLAAPWVQLFVCTGNGWPHNALRLYWLMPISCHFRDCKALLVTSLTHVSGAITSVQTFTFSFTCAVAERPRDAPCLSVVSFNSTIRRAQSSVIGDFGFRFTTAYTTRSPAVAERPRDASCHCH